MSAILRVRDLTKQFVKDDVGIVALRDFSLEIEEGGFVSILGRSGCGKSTMLNLLAGLTRPTSGVVTYRDEPLTRPRVEMGYLTQSDTLMPGATYAATSRCRWSSSACPHVAGGSARRSSSSVWACAVSNGTTPANCPEGCAAGSASPGCSSGTPTLLMDEPFGALDAQLRSDPQAELLRLWQGSGQTVVFVTHDIEEALLLGDRVVVLGRLGRVVLDKAVDLPRPRDADELRVEPTFVTLHKELTAALREGAR